MLRFVVFLTLVLLAQAEEASLTAARALYEAGRYAEATEAFDRLPSDSSMACYFRGKLAVQRRAYARAVELLERAVELAPRDAAATLWLGNAHAWSASVDEKFSGRIKHGRRALAMYRRAVELDPESVPARFALMNFYRHVPALLGGGTDRAYEQAREIARRDPDTGAYARALLSFHEKKYDLAYDTLAILRERNPQHYGANFLLGRLAVASGTHLAEGRAALQACLRLTPGENDDPHDLVTDLLKELEVVIARSAPTGAGG